MTGSPPFRYDARLASEIELRWQDRWEREGTFHAANPTGALSAGDLSAGFGAEAGRPKFYLLDFFPYPSGIGLHVGHPLGYIGTDVFGRYLRMTGHHVLHPFGFDTFGLPAEPFPIVYDEADPARPIARPIALPDAMLPVTLPEMTDFRPVPQDEASDPVPALARAPGWAEVTLDLGDGPRRYRRELNVMPQWAGSCWYYLRYTDPFNQTALADPRIERYWMSPAGVDLYVGGVEHAVLHLLYARFWHMVLYDCGVTSTPEPFGKLFNQGYILADAFTDARGLYVREDFAALRFHTAIARIIELTAHAARLPRVPRALAEPLVLLVAPLAPHIAEELWQRLGHASCLAREPFPQADPALVATATVTLPVQVNGRVRFTIEVPASADRDDIADLLAAHPAYPRDKVARLIIVPGKIANIVLR